LIFKVLFPFNKLKIFKVHNQIFKTFYLFLFFIRSINGISQNFSVSGKIFDSADNSELPGVVIKLNKKNDSLLFKVNTSDINGNFIFENIEKGDYKISFNLLGYKLLEKEITLLKENISLPEIKLNQNSKLLKEVIIEDKQIRQEQKGDTTQFNASAYKTNPDATTEDLIKKMPGVTTEGNTVKVNGEEIKKVLVDGKPFFGDDPSTTLKNLPADMVDKIQIFDKASDQAQFSGFKDGDEQKAINIITKGSKKVGDFGKIYAGYGLDDSLSNNRYNAGLAFNHFNGNQRISILAMSNNINVQNFSASDIMGLMGSPGKGGMRGGSDFFNGQQSGNTITNAVGLNFSDEWKGKVKINGSYFFNQTDNDNSTRSVRNYYTDNHLVYDNISQTKSSNLNHKLNLKVNYDIDSVNEIIITPRITYQEYNNKALGNNVTNEGGSVLNNASNTTKSNNAAINFQNDLLYQHKFKKDGRTISLNVNTQYNTKNGNGLNYSESFYYDTLNSPPIFIDQNYISNTNGNTIGGNITYTEPIGKNSQISIVYRPSKSYNFSDKETKSTNHNTGLILFDTTLSNKYNTTYLTQRGGLNYRYSTKKINLNFGADFQKADLSGDQTFPVNTNITKTFYSVLPSARLNYKINKSKNINLRYSSQTQSPSVSQLQNVLDVSNPLIVQSGNYQLKQTFENNLRARIGLTDTKKTNSFFVFLMGNQTFNYITNATYILNADTTILNYKLKRGSQLVKPINLNGYYQARVFSVYSFPLTKLKSNMSLNLGYSITRTPALINNIINYSNNNSYSAGTSISSNISENLDFSLMYNGNYNTVTNTSQSQSNSSYYNHSVTFKINYILFKRLVINTDVNQISYLGLNNSYNQNFILWNGYVGYKFLKNQSLEAKVSVFDLLKQNKSVSRNITETYTEDMFTQVLQRYFMFTLTYTFKKFKSGNVENPNNNDMPPPGMFRPHGPGGPPPHGS
jgi:hypothetical protein